MCGIAGIYSQTHPQGESVLREMTNSLAHRGPDDSGIWSDSAAGIGLGHRRLSIIDLSQRGRQPMRSSCGRFVIVYNGEVYNFPALRAELESLGHGFKGDSDTEVLLSAIVQWGLKSAVAKFVGMFAFALWDRQERSLSLVRDRIGIKPLYYGWADRQFLFGSELKSLRKVPGFNAEIDRDALALYFRHNYIPAPWTIYAQARKLKPGCILTVSAPDAVPVIEQYWSALEVWNYGARNEFSGSMDEAVDRLEEVLGEAVRSRMIADVPLGALLSGGIDSSAVVALMQKHSSRPVKTFSIGFHETAYNEAQHAAAVASHLGTDHTELYVTPRDMLDVVPLIPRFWDEPFADSSQIPTYLVSHLTREHVTVALSGDGGDELFAGYERYSLSDRWQAIEKIPTTVRKGVAKLNRMIGRGVFDNLGPIGHSLRWRFESLACESFADYYRFFMSHNRQPTNLVSGAEEPVSPMTAKYDMRFDDCIKQMTFWDVMAYLPDNILTKTDRASMAHALELRVPILDHRVVELAASLPTRFKVFSGTSKIVLRNLLYRYVPSPLVDRPKMGFGVPVVEWLQGPLHDWCRDLLSESPLQEEGYLDYEVVQQRVNRFMKGERRYGLELWNVLMFAAWLEEQG